MDDGSDNGLRLGWVGSDLQEGVTGVFCLRGRRISRAPSYNIKEKTLSTNDAKKKKNSNTVGPGLTVSPSRPDPSPTVVDTRGVDSRSPPNN